MLSQHPPPELLDRFRFGSLPDEDTRVVSNHLLWCEPCRRTVLDSRGLAGLLKAVFDHQAIAEYTSDNPVADEERTVREPVPAPHIAHGTQSRFAALREAVGIIGLTLLLFAVAAVGMFSRA
jgi:anti-sigma factor RsiW